MGLVSGWVTFKEKPSWSMGVDQLVGREGSASEVCGSITGWFFNKGAVRASEVSRVAAESPLVRVWLGRLQILGLKNEVIDLIVAG